MVFVAALGGFLGLLAAFWVYGMIGHTHPFQHFPIALVVLFVGFPAMGAALMVGLMKDFLGNFRK